MSPTNPRRLPDVESLPLFNPEAVCPKCKHPHVEAKYRTYTTAFSQKTTEWIRRMCLRCGYLWDERCLESTPADKGWAEDEEGWDDDEA